MDQRYTATCKVLKAISDPKRLKIVDMLSKGELCVGDLQETFKVSQPTLSHDMRILLEADVVQSRREGQRVMYSLNRAAIDKFNGVLVDIFTAKAK